MANPLGELPGVIQIFRANLNIQAGAPAFFRKQLISLCPTIFGAWGCNGTPSCQNISAFLKWIWILLLSWERHTTKDPNRLSFGSISSDSVSKDNKISCSLSGHVLDQSQHGREGFVQVTLWEMILFVVAAFGNHYSCTALLVWSCYTV